MYLDPVDSVVKKEQGRELSQVQWVECSGRYRKELNDIELERGLVQKEHSVLETGRLGRPPAVS